MTDKNRPDEGYEEEAEGKGRWVEEIEVAGSDLVDRVKDLIQQGNVRRLIIRKQDGEVLLEVPLTGAAVVGSVVTLWNPLLAGLGAMAALIARLKIEIVRVEEDEEVSSAKKKIDIEVDDEE